MDENLVGYLLNALEPEEHREVEAYLERSPEGRQRLELLRHALAPLEADRDGPEPPPGLVVRTLGRVAEHCCRDLPRAPLPARARGAGPGRPFWRRADVLLAASVALLVAGLAVTWVYRLRVVEADRMACEKNLTDFYAALKTYHDIHKEFPNVGKRKPPRNVAGMVAPMLVSAKVAPAFHNMRCPSSAAPMGPVPSVEDVDGMSDEEFDRHAPRLIPCYGYALGYRKDGNHYGPNRDPEANGSMPLMADRPPEDDLEANSPNHGGHGQNVLYQDGSVRYTTTRRVGYQGDDIYTNKARRIAAGLDPRDAVLGHSRARP